MNINYIHFIFFISSFSLLCVLYRNIKRKKKGCKTKFLIDSCKTRTPKLVIEDIMELLNVSDGNRERNATSIRTTVFSPHLTSGILLRSVELYMFNKHFLNIFFKLYYFEAKIIIAMLT